MVAGTLAFLLGVLALHHCAVLPPAGWLFVLTPLLLLWRRPALRWRRWLVAVSAAAAGFLWAWGYAAVLLHHGLPPALEGRDLWVEGYVSSLPESLGERVRFEFEPHLIWRDGERLALPGRLRLSWYRDAPALRVGQQWRLQVRLKRPHGMANPGTFDYELWLLQRGVRATGYVRDAQRVGDDAARFPLQRLRQQLRDRLQGMLGEHPLGGIVIALALGERQGISKAQWQVLRATGTNHLVAISGLHVGIVAALVFFLLQRLWSLSGRACLRLPAPRAAAIGAMTAATGYAALAGFSVPTQRALIMVAVALLAVWLQRPLQPLRTLALALLLVLLYDPLAALAAGTWLSFAAVAVILYGMGGRPAARGWWWRWGRVQWLVALGLAPLMLYWFQQAALVGPLANLVAVPWVTVAVVPPLLLALLLLLPFPGLALWLLQLCLFSLEYLWQLLDWMARLLPPEFGALAPPGWTLLPALIGLSWLLAPRGWPARWVGGFWLLPLLFARAPAPAPGEVWLTQLDVGQGLAVVLRTTHHTLLFDTGPRYSDALDAAEAVIVPYLRGQGVTRLDTLVVSHGDSDHSGGTASLLAALPVRRILTTKRPWPWAGNPGLCRRGMRWEWDGVVFQLLYPTAAAAEQQGNEASCVLRVTAAGHNALLTGDIEAGAEAALLADAPSSLAATVLVAPHHGSKTSSTLPFVTAVAPRYVLFAVGYRNRYGFPHPSVVARYRVLGAQLLGSAGDGAVTVQLGAGPPRLIRFRHQAHRYWFSD